ncbi:MAG: hypothetical protein MI810_00620 [Flavobacteriales bacterium]|nr:hypothetical protein [Flavobacteriales bacterium]
MKKLGAKLKSFGIISSYLWLLISVYWFNWTAFSVFLVYVVEFAIIGALFLIGDLFFNLDLKKVESRPFSVMFIGTLVFVLIQLGLTLGVSASIDPDFFDKNSKIITEELLWIGAAILIFYLLKLIMIEKGNKLYILESNMLTQAAILAVTNLLGLLVVFLTGPNHLMIVMTCVIAARCGLEFYFNKEIFVL